MLHTFNEGGSIRQGIESLLRLGADQPIEIMVVYAWNYAASFRFVWNYP